MIVVPALGFGGLVCAIGVFCLGYLVTSAVLGEIAKGRQEGRKIYRDTFHPVTRRDYLTKRGIERFSIAGGIVAVGLVVLLLGWAAIQEYDLVFDKYYQNYRQSAWNYSEMGGVIKSFSESSGSPETAWVMGYPHWADTRLVAIEAGYPERDYATFIDGLESTAQDPQPKLFLVHLDDNEAIRALKEVFPLGWVQTYESSVENRDFLMYFTQPVE